MLSLSKHEDRGHMSENLLAHLQSVLGICAIIGLAWAFSEDRRAFRFRMVAVSLLLQAAIALVLLKFPPARALLLGLNNIVTVLGSATTAGASFVFGYVGGGTAPFSVTNPAAMTSFAFGVLPLVIVISALSALLWYWRVLPLIVGGIALVLRRT